jgi:hypothetical protein
MRIRYYIDFETELGATVLGLLSARPRPDDIRVIYVPDPEPESFFVITAYELHGKPLKACLRRVRKRRSS